MQFVEHLLIHGSSWMHKCTHYTYIVLFLFLIVHTCTCEYMPHTYVWFCSLVPIHAHINIWQHTCWSHFWFFMHAQMNTWQAYPGFHACSVILTRQRAASLQRLQQCLMCAYTVCVAYMHAWIHGRRSHAHMNTRRAQHLFSFLFLHTCTHIADNARE